MTTNDCFITSQSQSSNVSSHFPLSELDIKEHAVVERWRHMEKNRQEQQRNPKHGLSSTDQSTLARQIHDKLLFKDDEQKLSKAYVRDSTKHEAIVHLLEIRQEQDRRSLARDINEFRTTYQQSKNAREYDLNDLPTSITVCNGTNNNVQCGPGSCLYFQGEDRNKRDRERKQKEQMNRWITEQCRQKDEAEKEQEMLDEAYHCNQLMITKYGMDLEATQMILRRQMEDNIKAFSRALANEKRCQRNIKETFELEDKKQEIQNMLMDNILTENRNLAISQFGAQRPLLTHWKGMTKEESRDYQSEQIINTEMK